MSQATGINGEGQIVGWFDDATGIHGFLYSGGTFTTIDDSTSGVFATQVNGINNSGQIVGDIWNDAGIHGFVATPVPEPCSSPILGFLIGLFGVCRWRSSARRSRHAFLFSRPTSI